MGEDIVAKRHESYESTLQYAISEYMEIADQVRRMGKRLRDLKMAIDGLSGITNRISPISMENNIVVSTPETRMDSHIMRRK